MFTSMDNFIEHLIANPDDEIYFDEENVFGGYVPTNKTHKTNAAAVLEPLEVRDRLKDYVIAVLLQGGNDRKTLANDIKYYGDRLAAQGNQDCALEAYNIAAELDPNFNVIARRSEAIVHLTGKIRLINCGIISVELQKTTEKILVALQSNSTQDRMCTFYVILGAEKNTFYVALSGFGKGDSASSAIKAKLKKIKNVFLSLSHQKDHTKILDIPIVIHKF